MKYLWLIVLAGFIAAVSWRLGKTPALPEVPPVSATSSTWQVPQARERDVQAALDSLTRNSPWGVAPGGEADRPLTPPIWQVGGVVENGPDRFVLIRTEGLPVAQLRIGETLPGGAKLIAIESDRLGILLNGKARSLRIYRE